jgi:hypothetical protein
VFLQPAAAAGQAGQQQRQQAAGAAQALPTLPQPHTRPMAKGYSSAPSLLGGLELMNYDDVSHGLLLKVRSQLRSLVTAACLRAAAPTAVAGSSSVVHTAALRPQDLPGLATYNSEPSVPLGNSGEMLPSLASLAGAFAAGVCKQGSGAAGDSGAGGGDAAGEEQDLLPSNW